MNDELGPEPESPARLPMIEWAHKKCTLNSNTNHTLMEYQMRSATLIHSNMGVIKFN